jgi:hypothetical protein
MYNVQRGGLQCKDLPITGAGNDAGLLAAKGVHILHLNLVVLLVLKASLASV